MTCIIGSVVGLMVNSTEDRIGKASSNSGSDSWHLLCTVSLEKAIKPILSPAIGK